MNKVNLIHKMTLGPYNHDYQNKQMIMTNAHYYWN